MYKITNNRTLINEINLAAKLKEGNQDVNYCEIKKHPIKDEYAIPIIENILIGYNLSFFEELLTGLVDILPENWNWPYEERPIRLTIPLDLQAKSLVSAALNEGNIYDSLGQLFNAILPIIGSFIITTETHVIVYLEELYPDHRQLFEMFENILIEQK